MLRRYCLALLSTAACASAALLPEAFAGYKKLEARAVALEQPAVWVEYGLEAWEQADYARGAKRLTVTAWRLRDTTGALAAYQWQRPAAAHPVKDRNWTSSVTGGGITMHANYVLSFTGELPPVSAIEELGKQLPEKRQASLPVLWSYVPPEGLETNSERYVLGPASLAAFEPRIALPQSAFEMGGEGQLARYSDGQVLAIFSFPTPQIAGAHLRGLSNTAGIESKRSGPLVLLTMGGSGGRTLLERVKYQPKITWSEAPPPPMGNPGEMILAIMILAGFLIVGSIVAGLFLGTSKVFLRKLGFRVADDERLTSLDLNGRY